MKTPTRLAQPWLFSLEWGAVGFYGSNQSRAADLHLIKGGARVSGGRLPTKGSEDR